jgi:NACalpha-BTF3-like transcription factor
VGTAHGNTLENLMLNPTLADLIGGIQSVTLGDEEARRRGTQKSILERTSPPTFDIVVEIQERDRVAIHPDVAEAVDATLRGQPIDTEVRWLDENGEVRVEKPLLELKKGKEKKPVGRDQQRIYLFGVNRGRLEHMAKEVGIDLEIVDKVGEANLLVTSKNYYRRKPQKVRDAEAASLPIYVLKSNTPPQIRQMLQNIYPLAMPGKRDSFQVALAEAEEAVAKIKNGEGEVELSPQSAYIRRLQHLIAERNEMASKSEGKDPNRRVKIYKG